MTGHEEPSAMITVDLLPESGTASGARDAQDKRALVGIRVLLVDDDDDIRDVFQEVLEHYGAHVQPAASTAAALAMHAIWRPDVLLSDLAMPGENGFELMRQINARPNPPPSAALTAHATSEGREQAVMAGFRLYLAKPLDSVVLVEAVAMLAGRLAPPAEPRR